MSRYVTKTMYLLDLPKRPTSWNGGSIKLFFNICSSHFILIFFLSTVNMPAENRSLSCFSLYLQKCKPTGQEKIINTTEENSSWLVGIVYKHQSTNLIKEVLRWQTCLLIRNINHQSITMLNNRGVFWFYNNMAIVMYGILVKSFAVA